VLAGFRKQTNQSQASVQYAIDADQVAELFLNQRCAIHRQGIKLKVDMLKHGFSASGYEKH